MAAQALPTASAPVSALPAFNKAVVNRRHIPELQRLGARRTPGDADAFLVELAVGGRSYALKITLGHSFPAAPPAVRLYCGATAAAAAKVKHLNIARDAAADADGYRALGAEIWSCNGALTWSLAYGIEQLLEHVRQLLTTYPADAAPPADPQFQSYPPVTPYAAASQAQAAADALEGWDTVVKSNNKLVVVKAVRKAAAVSANASNSNAPHLTGPSTNGLNSSSNSNAHPSPPSSTPTQPAGLTSSLYQVAQLLPSSAEDSASMLVAGGEDLHLDAASLTASLRCFFTGLAPGDAGLPSATAPAPGPTVLCLPLSSTRNPKTGRTDVLYAHLDGYVSLAAYKEAGVRHTPCGEKFTQVLPLYIDDRHFGAAAQAALSDTLRGLGLERLEFFSTLLTSFVVMLADGGVAAVERGLHCLFHVLHLAAKLLSRHALHELVDRHVDGFLNDAQRRRKAATPNLGHLAALALLGRKATPARTLAAAAPKLLMEAFVRNVLWICKNRADVAAALRAGGAGPDDAELAAAAFEGSKNSMRVFCLFRLLEAVELADGGSHAAFVAGLDALSGFASPVQVRRFRSGLAKVRAAAGWPEVLRMLGVTVMDDAGIARQVRQAWKLSLAAGYHSEDTDFSAIQRSGVSQLLRKGETYNGLDRKDQKITFVSDWRFETNETQFLDATLFLTDASGTCLDTIDFSNRQSRFPGAVHHSGDVMRHQGGEHTVHVSLGRIPAQVANVFLAVSAWRPEARLGDVQQPRVTVRDAADGQALCAYALEEQPAALLAARQCVVLCRLSRNTAGSTPPWRLLALGEMGMGNANDYEPIRATLRALQAAEKGKPAAAEA